jgi:xylan 1,4-beta-xylosidase
MSIGRLLGAALGLALALASGACAQDTAPRATVRVDVAKPVGALARPWSFFGYDEPNFTYSANGVKLLRELVQLSPVPVYVRAHNLLTSGDGTGSLKWGSTNAYTEDAQGRPVYDWKIVDRIFDAYRDAGVRPLVEIGFMPEALTTGPAPYRHDFPHGSIFTAWTYPPKDYAKWGELVYQFARHLRERYGDATVKTWLWEVWNEPDIPYWHGTAEEFFRLYDVSADAVLRAIPFAEVGGPDTTGPASPRAEEFLRQFLEHCAHGKNYATGKTGSHVDFISFHPKGANKWVDGHVRMGLAEQLKAADTGFKIVASFPEWRETPVILGENDPEGCAGCSPKDHPEDNYRNSSIYAAYSALDIKNAMALAALRGVTLKGAVTWAFQFDGQPYFAGFRDLATNGVDKPVLNGFRALGMLGETQLAATSSAAVPAEAIEQNGVPAPVVDAIAARKAREVEVLLMHYRDDDVPGPEAHVALNLTGLPTAARQVRLEVFRVDATHSNSFAAWQAMGSPQQPTAEQYRRLEAAGQLQRDGAVRRQHVHGNALRLDVKVPTEGLALIRIAW